MNDPQFSWRILSDLLQSARNDNLEMAGKAAIYSAARFIAGDFREYFEGHGYALEKIHQYESHLASMLGFDIDNGHDRSAHFRWSMGALDTLKNLVAERDA